MKKILLSLFLLLTTAFMYAAEVTFEVKDRAGNAVIYFEVFIEGENGIWMHIPSNPETGKATTELDNGEYSYRINTREEKNTLIPFKGVFSMGNSAKTISTDYTKAKAVNFQPEIPPGYDGYLSFIIEEKTFISVETLTYYGLPGTYKYKLTNGLSSDKEFTISQDDIDVNIKLTNLQFQLKDVEGNAFSSVYITLYNNERSAHYGNSTDENGIMKLIAVEGDYSYNISFNNYLSKSGDFSVKSGVDNKFDISFQDYKKLRLEYEGLANNISKNLNISTLDGARNLNYSSNENENQVDLYLPYDKYRWYSYVEIYGDKEGEMDFSEKENTLIIDYSNFYKTTFEVSFPDDTDDKLDMIYIFQGKKEITVNRNDETNEYYSYLENGSYTWRYEFNRDDYYGKSNIQPEFTVAGKDIKVTATHSPNDFHTTTINLQNIPFTGEMDEDMYFDVEIFKDGISHEYAYDRLGYNDTSFLEDFILAPGSYKIEFGSEGADNKVIIPFSKDFVVGNSNTTINYDFNTILKKYTFQIKDNSSQKEINPSATLVYNNEGKILAGMSTTDSEENNYTLYVISPSEYTLRSVATDYRSGTKILNATNLQSENFDIFLEKGNVGLVGFYIFDSNYDNIEGAVVRLEGYGEVLTQGGEAIFFDIPLSDNPITYTITMSGYETVIGTIVVNKENFESGDFGVYKEIRMIPGGTNITENQTSQFSIYPNPVYDYVYIQSNEDVSGIWTASLFTTNGTLVKTEQVDMDNQPSINLSDIDTGLYFLRLSNGDNIVTLKVMKK